MEAEPDPGNSIISNALIAVCSWTFPGRKIQALNIQMMRQPSTPSCSAAWACVMETQSSRSASFAWVSSGRFRQHAPSESLLVSFSAGARGALRDLGRSPGCCPCFVRRKIKRRWIRNGANHQTMNRTMSPHSATPASNIDQSVPSNPRNRLSLVARMIMTSLGDWFIPTSVLIRSTPACLFLRSIVFVLFAAPNH